MNTSRKTLTSIFSIALLMTSLSARGFAQTGTVGTQEGDKTTLEQNVYGLGLNFSLASGIGISFKEHFARSRWSYMLTGYADIDNSGGSGDATYDYGAEIQYDIYLKQETRFYALAGISYFYQGGEVNSPDPVAGIKQSIQNTLAGPTRIGAGAGIETAVSSAICCYANITVTSFQPSGDLFIFPYAGVMIYFK